MRRWILALILLGAGFVPVQAGLYSSLEPVNAFPVHWRGFLPDHRTLRLIAVDPALRPGLPSLPLRESHADLILTLDAASKSRVLTATEAADLGAAYVRLGQPEKAIGILRLARRRYPDDHKLAANHGTACQLSGDLASAELALDDAVRFAPESLKAAERLHLKLVRIRIAEGKSPADRWDDLFGREADYEKAKVPAQAVALVQQLAIWLPADGRLLWQLAEMAHASGDDRTAANILDGCVAEFAMSSPLLRAHRTAYRQSAERLANDNQHETHRGTIVFRSKRVLGTTFDASKLPAIRSDRPNPLPWGAIQEVTVGKGFTPKFLSHVDKLDGKMVSLIGYPAPAGDGADGASFLLTEYPVGCWFCEAPDATSLVRVELAPGLDATTVSRGSIKLTGTLKLNRTDPERFLYTLENARLAVAD